MSSFAKIDADPMIWRMIPPWSYQRRNAPLDQIAQAALESIAKIEGSTDFAADKDVAQAVSGAMTAVSVYVDAHPEAAPNICRQVAKFLCSQHFEVAWNTLIRFDGPTFSPYSMLVLDSLLKAATCECPPSSPIDMTNRGLAFLVLFRLDPQFRNSSELAQAREECVRGLQTWPSGGSRKFKERSRRAAAQITRYLSPSRNSSSDEQV